MSFDVYLFFIGLTLDRRHSLIEGTRHLQGILLVVVDLHDEVVVLGNELVQDLFAVKAEVCHRVLFGRAKNGIVPDWQGAEAEADVGLTTER